MARYIFESFESEPPCEATVTEFESTKDRASWSNQPLPDDVVEYARDLIRQNKAQFHVIRGEDSYPDYEPCFRLVINVWLDTEEEE